MGAEYSIPAFSRRSGADNPVTIPDGIDLLHSQRILFLGCDFQAVGVDFYFLYLAVVQHLYELVIGDGVAAVTHTSDVVPEQNATMAMMRNIRIL